MHSVPRVFKSNKFYYLMYERIIEVKDLNLDTTVTKLKLINISNVIKNNNYIYFMDTLGNVYEFDENTLKTDLFLNNTSDLIKFTYFNRTLNSIIIVGYIKFNVAVIKIDIKTKHDIKFFFPKSLIKDIYYYDDNIIKLIGSNENDIGTLNALLEFDLRKMSLISSRSIFLNGCTDFINNRYQFGFDSKYFHRIYDKKENDFIILKYFGDWSKLLLYVYDYQDYYYLSSGTISEIVDSNFKPVKRYDAKFSKKLYSVVPDIYLDDRFVIYRLDGEKFKFIKKEEFFSNNLIDCEIAIL